MSSRKYKLIILAASIFCLSLEGKSACATETNPVANGNDSRLIKRLAKQTQVLESRLRYLQDQLTALKKNQQQTDLSFQSSSGIHIVPKAKHPIYIIGTPVISSPYIGINSEYNASDLVVNQPYVNEDLYLLQQKKQIFSYFFQNHYPIPNNPLINLSGKIEAQVLHSDYFGNFQNNSITDIDLTGIELDAELFINEWTTGLMAFVYDNSPPNTSPRRIDNSNVFLERGFLTFGSLVKFPIYGTIGQFYVPFGQYASSMIVDPLTKTLGRTKARAISLGFSKEFNAENNLNLAAFVFRGPSRTSLDNNGLRNYGANIDYTLTKSNWDFDIAASYIRNLADSFGMQHNGNSGDQNFNGFASSDMSEVFDPVPGLDAHGSLGIGPFSLIAEYITASRSFAQSALTFNGRGAKPQALHTEAAYKFNIWTKPSALIIGYDQSKDALALLLPKRRYVATASTSIWKDTIESLEFRHDIDYNASDVAVGQFLNPINGTGKCGNTITLQVGLYF